MPWRESQICCRSSNVDPFAAAALRARLAACLRACLDLPGELAAAPLSASPGYAPRKGLMLRVCGLMGDDTLSLLLLFVCLSFTRMSSVMASMLPSDGARDGTVHGHDVPHLVWATWRGL